MSGTSSSNGSHSSGMSSTSGKVLSSSVSSGSSSSDSEPVSSDGSSPLQVGSTSGSSSSFGGENSSSVGSESSGSSTSLSNSEHAEIVGSLLGLGSSDGSHASDVSESVEVSSTSSSEHSSVVVSNVAETSVLRLGESTEVTVGIVTSGDGLGEMDIASSVTLVPDGFTSSSVSVTSAHGSALVPGLSSSHVSSVEFSNVAVFVMPVGLNTESSLGLVTEDTHVHSSVGPLDAEHGHTSVSSLVSSLLGEECSSLRVPVTIEASSCYILLMDIVSIDTHSVVVSGS